MSLRRVMMLVVDGSVFSQYSSVRTPPTLSLVNYFGGNSGLVKSTTIKGCFCSLRANVRSGLSRSILLACSWAGLMSHANSQNQLPLNAHFRRADSALAVSGWVAAKRSGCGGSRTIGIGGSTKREWGVDRELDGWFWCSRQRLLGRNPSDFGGSANPLMCVCAEGEWPVGPLQITTRWPDSGNPKHIECFSNLHASDRGNLQRPCLDWWRQWALVWVLRYVGRIIALPPRLLWVEYVCLRPLPVADPVP